MSNLPAKPPGGKLAVLTRSTAGNQAWAAYLHAHGIATYGLPGITTKKTRLTPVQIDLLRRVGQFDWLVFTSAAGVRYLLEQAKFHTVPLPEGRPKTAVVGEKTAAAALKNGLSVDFRPRTPNGHSLGLELPLPKNSSILLARSTIAGRDLPDLLRRRGASVAELPVYDTIPTSNTDENFNQLLQQSRIGWLVFASPSAVRAFSNRLSPALRKLAQTLPAIATGPTTAHALQAGDFQDIHVAPKPNAAAIAAVITSLSQAA
jgi:uroporphyrinogen-III synthase